MIRNRTAVVMISPNQYRFRPTGTGRSRRAAHVSFAPSALQSLFRYLSTRLGMTATRTRKKSGIHRMPFQKYSDPPSRFVFVRYHRSDMLKFVTSETRK